MIVFFKGGIPWGVQGLEDHRQACAWPVVLATDVLKTLINLSLIVRRGVWMSKSGVGMWEVLNAGYF